MCGKGRICYLSEKTERCFCGTIGLSPSIFKAIPTTFFLVLHFVFVFPPFSTSWKKGINDERRLGSHQFSSSTCKEASQYFALLFSSAHSAAEPENGDLILDCSERWMSFVSQQGDDALVTHTLIDIPSKQG